MQVIKTFTELLFDGYHPCISSNSMAIHKEVHLYGHTFARYRGPAELRPFLSEPWRTPALCNEQFITEHILRIGKFEFEWKVLT